MQDTTAPGGGIAAGASSNDLQQLAQMADALVESVGEARQRLDELQAILDGSAADSAAPVAPAFDEAPEEHEPDMGREGIRLYALNMALSGSTRDVTREHLLESFPDASLVTIEDVLETTFGAHGPGAVTATAPGRRRFPRFHR